MTNYEIKHDDVIDSRDLILLANEIKTDPEHTPADLNLAIEIEELGEEVGDDWEYGESLIAKNYFEHYARELAEEIGAINTEYTWPISCIDWEQAAHELAFDYSFYTLDGRDYYIRAS